MPIGNSTGISELSEFTPEIDVPINGQNLGNADLTALLQGLANRTRYLLNALKNQAYYVLRARLFSPAWTKVRANQGYVVVPIAVNPAIGDQVEISLEILCTSDAVGAAAFPSMSSSPLANAASSGFAQSAANAFAIAGSGSGSGTQITLVGNFSISASPVDQILLYVYTTSAGDVSPITAVYGTIKLVSQ